MRKKTGKTLIPFFMSFILLAGCQKAPEVSSDDEILRAKGSAEEAVEDIIGGDETGSADEGEGEEKAEEAGMMEGSAESRKVSMVLGSGENRMKIEAEVPVVPETVNLYTMRGDSGLNEETLRAFLEPQGEVENITEKLLAEWEAEKKRIEEIDEKLGEGSSIVEIATFGNESYLALSDGNREAVFSGAAGGSYKDALLEEKCRAIAGQEAQELDAKDMEAGGASFSLQDAKGILLQKLSYLGIEDVNLFEVHFWEENGFVFYEMQFSPVVDHIPLAYSFGQEEPGEVHPNGYAWVCEEGTAEIGLWNFCMEQASVEEGCRILSFDKAAELLETYLDNGMLQCRENVPFSTAELVWYPKLRGKELELVPMWSVCMDLGEYIDYCGESGVDDSVWNIYIDAVSGELEKVR